MGSQLSQTLLQFKEFAKVHDEEYLVALQILVVLVHVMVGRTYVQARIHFHSLLRINHVFFLSILLL